MIRAVRFCSAFNLPIISLLLPRQHEAVAEGVSGIGDLANLISAYSEAAVPKLAVVTEPEAIFVEKVRHSKPGPHPWAPGTPQLASRSRTGSVQTAHRGSAERGAMWCTHKHQPGTQFVVCYDC